MRIKAWNFIEPATMGAAPLQPGGYVVRIVDVKDNYNPNDENKCYLDLIYDIAEGPEAGRYSDDWGKSHPYAHQSRQWYEGKHEGRFRHTLECLEQSNRGRFSVADWTQRCNERELIGLEFGIVLQKLLDYDSKGNETEYLEDRGVYASQDIRNGDFKLPEPRNKRDKTNARISPVAEASSGLYDEDVPF